MASTGILNGTKAIVQVGGTAIAHLTSNGIDFSHSTRDTSSKDSAGWKEGAEGQKSWSMSAEGYFAEDASYGYSDLFTAFKDRTKLTVTYTTDETGDLEYSGDCYITSLTRSDGMEDSTTFSVSLEGTGPVTATTIV